MNRAQRRAKAHPKKPPTKPKLIPLQIHYGFVLEMGVVVVTYGEQYQCALKPAEVDAMIAALTTTKANLLQAQNHG